MKTSKELTRTQLVGMVAVLRGELSSLTNAYRCSKECPDRPDLHLQDDDMEDAEHTLALTTFGLSEEDEVDGGFDKSWMELSQHVDK